MNNWFLSSFSSRCLDNLLKRPRLSWQCGNDGAWASIGQPSPSLKKKGSFFLFPTFVSGSTFFPTAFSPFAAVADFTGCQAPVSCEDILPLESILPLKCGSPLASVPPVNAEAEISRLVSVELLPRMDRNVNSALAKRVDKWHHLAHAHCCAVR